MLLPSEFLECLYSIISSTLQNNLGWKGSTEVIWSNTPLRAGPILKLDQVAQGHLSSQYIQEWRCHSFCANCLINLI